MSDDAGSWTPVVAVDLLVRRPAAEVWEAFADPEQICRFWLARSSGRLESGSTVHWTFKIAGAESDVTVVEAVPGSLLDLRWDGGQPLRFTFEDRGDATLVTVRVTDFGGDKSGTRREAGSPRTASRTRARSSDLHRVESHGQERDRFDVEPPQCLRLLVEVGQARQRRLAGALQSRQDAVDGLLVRGFRGIRPLVAHKSSRISWRKALRSLRIASNVRVFTVPRGIPVLAAISLCDNPS